MRQPAALSFLVALLAGCAQQPAAEPGSVVIATNAGLVGQGDEAAPLAVDFAGTGSAGSAARSDHSHLLAEENVSFSFAGSSTKGGAALDAEKLGGLAASQYMTEAAGDARYLAAAGQATDSAQLGGEPAASYLLKTDVAADAQSLGGLPASQYMLKTDTAADSLSLGGVAANQYLTLADADGRYLGSDGRAADSAQLGGVAASSYMLKTDTAADSQRLGGVEASEYLVRSNADARYLASGGQASDSAKLGGLAASSYLLATDALEVEQLPTDALARVSGGALDVRGTLFSAGPEPIPDNSPLGVTSYITVPNLGAIDRIWVSIDLMNSSLSSVRVDLIDPANGAVVLHDRNTSGSRLQATYPDPTAPVAGDLNSWIGRNPAGSWRLRVIDSQFLNNSYDGQFSWSLELRSAATPVVTSQGHFRVTHGLSVGGDLAMPTVGTGIILRAFDGTNCFRLRTNNAGELSTAAVACPN